MQEIIRSEMQHSTRQKSKSSSLPFKDLLDTQVSVFLKNPQKKVLLIKGEAFTGKTGYAQKLTQDYKEDWLVLYVDVSKILNPIKCLVDEGLKKMGFTLEKALSWKNNPLSSFLFVIDNLDERTLYYNLYATNQLWQWTYAKVIFLTRPIYFIPQENDRIYYTPFRDSRAYPDALEEIILPAITASEIKEAAEYLRLHSDSKLQSLVLSHRFLLYRYKESFEERKELSESKSIKRLLQD